MSSIYESGFSANGDGSHPSSSGDPGPGQGTLRAEVVEALADERAACLQESHERAPGRQDTDRRAPCRQAGEESGVPSSQPSPEQPDKGPQAEREEIRDNRGRFAKGTCGGPGNPYNRQVALLKKTLLNAVTPERILKIGSKLCEMAEAGNLAAARILTMYALPKHVDPDRVDIEEWKLYKETSGMMAELRRLMQAPHAEFLVTLMRELREAATRNLATPMLGMLRSTPKEREAVFDMGPDDGLAVFKRRGMAAAGWDQARETSIVSAEKPRREKPLGEKPRGSKTRPRGLDAKTQPGGWKGGKAAKGKRRNR